MPPIAIGGCGLGSNISSSVPKACLSSSISLSRPLGLLRSISAALIDEDAELAERGEEVRVSGDVDVLDDADVAAELEEKGVG